MAGQQPSFITGANAKIQAGGITFAYASDVSYNVSVDTIPVETMGRYEAVSNEPVNFSVSGELGIVRYTNIAKLNNIPGAATNGNGLENAAFNSGGTAADHFNPANMLFGKSWDLAVFQKIQAAENATPTTVASAVVQIKDCRFTRLSSGLNKRGILVDRMAFMGILYNDDSYTAGNSGDQDLSS